MPEVDEARLPGVSKNVAIVTHESAGGVDDAALLEVAEEVDCVEGMSSSRRS